MAKKAKPIPVYCPKCNEGKLTRNGTSSSGVQRWRCRSCGFSMTGNPTGRPPIFNEAMTNAQHWELRKLRAKMKAR